MRLSSLDSKEEEGVLDNIGDDTQGLCMEERAILVKYLLNHVLADRFVLVHSHDHPSDFFVGDLEAGEEDRTVLSPFLVDQGQIPELLAARECGCCHQLSRRLAEKGTKEAKTTEQLVAS